MKISQVKNNLQTIITNLSQLQTYRDNLTQDNLATESEKIANSKINIENALISLESQDMKKVVNKLKQRRSKRICLAKKIKAFKVAAISSKSNATRVKLSFCEDIPEQQQTNALWKRKVKDARKYLAIMDSLDTLHKLRNSENGCKLNESLSSIRTTWEATAEMAKKKLQKPKSIEAQWKQVLFGDTSKPSKSCRLKEFIERRLVWDSYIVADDDPSGSCIPIGWVCPRENTRPDWILYRV